MKRGFLFFAFLTIKFSLSAQTGNVGINTTTPASTLTVNGSFAAAYRVVSAGTTIGLNDFYVAYNGAADGTLTLPAAVAGSGNFAGRTYHFKNTGTANLTITANGSELIDNQGGAGVSSVQVPPGYYAFIINKGTVTNTTWELVLLSSSSGIPTAASTLPFSTIATATRQTLPATPGASYVVSEINYPDGMVINTGNVLNTANGRFTAPAAGFYMFYGSTQFDNGALSGAPAFGFTVLYLVKNYSTNPNNRLVQSYQLNPGTLVGSSVSCITYLNAGDTVSMAAAASVSTGSTFQVVVSSLYGYKIAN